MKRKINKPILLSALALTQGVGTVMVMQNSIVQVYAEQKNKEVTSQEFLDCINQLKEQNPDFKFSQGETKLIQKSPAFEQRTEEDYTYTDGEPYSGSAILSIKEFNEDFGRVYVGELTEEDAKKYMGITAVVTMYYDSSDKLRDGLSMTRSVEYSIDRW